MRASGLINCTAAATLSSFDRSSLRVIPGGARVVTRAASTVDAPVATAMAHPLTELSGDEIRAASAACRAHAQSKDIPQLRFNVISLHEPAKAELVTYQRAEGGDLHATSQHVQPL